ncbi:hypothetical protein A3A14_02445 [Candidatus Daviesbacteria bacterium RIFCSPLOWO2_01_FULL_43_38]|uniref:Damage-inducible protein J n=3 Tax=Candidatus Daviesiibacteriota TaxID=1752718 RepID=A0A1F5K1V5_9BACT|nr:MAG: Damage inducible-like protein [Candidatus Daviesbacteria bacterium GW2011_GWA1_42_6]KKS69621.1 MAG: Damage inducible-like protein [Candidatus Daviesbacteria bacterium GW2011_GWA2_42_7]OGE19107.1 MAG: hypothetical protein A2874_01850 [Candidatus Daviesbacteria bacterium RIFCSPHIGHO2_01_FULL_43_17]OGE34815.1 MAG: hypothetical protein A3E45_02465 [Candidatus Daviesbacteria bacterium RIFCSPHIGHO2_12_FULL_43_11]OGE64024.1 MAG: hypothetical protein A3A14_02445 [Candidatus Daviesbacteria bacte
MNTAIVNVKVNPTVKRQAQKVAEDMGLSLSALVNGFLKNLVKTKTVTFTASEEPTPYLLRALKESKEDIKAGKVSPTFTNAKDAINWLNKQDKKYARQVLQKVQKTI